MPKYKQSIYKPLNPKKYIGSGTIRMRSSWETAAAHFFDHNDNIIEWASESIRIPYKHPLTGKMSTYVPDFIIRYRDRRNKIITELIEVKPHDQSILKEGMSANQRATVAVNFAKWEAARFWCKKQGIAFRILTEKHLFRK